MIPAYSSISQLQLLTVLPKLIVDEFLVVNPASTDENAWGADWNAPLNEYFTLRRAGRLHRR